ncbi:MAG TPA: site-specific integrase [Terracidiphilus sp.]|nr:site-specific integrase [Terracidiphilus sp.]
MRPGELDTAEWSQVDCDRRAIELTETKNGYARTVRLNTDALDAIRSMQLPGQRQSGRIFRRATEKHFQNKSWFTPVLDDAKITGATFYTCRQTFCSWLAMAGASMKDLQEAAGHKTITMSARYAHPFSGAHAISRGQNRHYWTNSHQNSHQEVFNMVPGGGLEPPRRVSSCGF